MMNILFKRFRMILFYASLFTVYSCTDSPSLDILDYSREANFGTVTLLRSKVLTFTLQNPTKQNLVLGSMTNAGLELSLPFNLEGGTCETRQTLAPDESCELEISFSPITENLVEQKISISFTVNENDKLKVKFLTLSGTGYLDCDYNLDQAGCPQDRDLDVVSHPWPLNFGSADIGSFNQMTFTIQNVDVDDPITLGEISDEGFGIYKNSKVFQILTEGTTCSSHQTLAVAETCQITMAFAPTEHSYSIYQRTFALPYNENNSLDGDEDEAFVLELRGWGVLNCGVTPELLLSKGNGVRAAQAKMEQETIMGTHDGEALTYNQGHTTGYNETFSSNYNSHYNTAYSNYYNIGYNTGYNDEANNSNACRDGRGVGQAAGREDGIHDGDYDGYNDGYDTAYSDGKADGILDGFDDGDYDVCKINDTVQLPDLSLYQQACYNQGYVRTYRNQYSIAFEAARNANREYNRGVTAGRSEGTNDGESQGSEDGQAAGRTDGQLAGLADGYDDTYARCESNNYVVSYQSYYNSSYNTAYDEGSYDGYYDGYDDGYDEGYDEGYNDGYCSISSDTYPLSQKSLSTDMFKGSTEASRYGFGRSWIRTSRIGTSVDVFKRSIPVISSVRIDNKVVDISQKRQMLQSDNGPVSLREQLSRQKLIEYKNRLRPSYKSLRKSNDS